MLLITPLRLLLLPLLATLQACAPTQVARRNWTSQDGPEQALVLAQSGLTALDDLTAEARITFRQGRTRRAAMASVLYKRPDLFRVDVRGPLYRHLLSLLLRGEQVTVVAGRQTVHGDAASPLLAELTAFDLGDYDARHALLGVVQPPPTRGLELGIRQVTYPRADRALVHVREAMGAERILWIDLQRGLVTKEQIRRHGRLVWTRELEDYREFQTARGLVYLSRKVTFIQGELGLELDYKSYRIDEGLSVEALQAGIPLPEE